jgi:branched-chain amino acid transport system substrate-binding protein
MPKYLIATWVRAFVFMLVSGAFFLVHRPVYADPILIGQTHIATGPLAGLSADPLVGIRAMFNAVNEEGGINGRLIELRQLDDASDLDRAYKNVKTLASAGAVAILMPIGSASAAGAVKAANELKVPLVGSYTGAKSVLQYSKYGFPVRISFDEESARIVNHLAALRVSKVAVIHNDNPGAREGMESFKKFFEQRDQKLAGNIALKNDGSDAEIKAIELAKLKPNAVALVVSNPVAAKFIKAYRAAGADSSLYAISFLNGKLLHNVIGNDAAGVVISQVVPYPWGSDMAVITEYQAAMQKIGVKEYSYGSLEGYISARILIEAIRRAGPKLSSEAVKKSLESMNSFNLGGLQVKYTPTEHRGLTFSELSMIRKNGGFIR